MRTVITDAIWGRMEPMVAAAKWHKGGREPELPDREFFEAVSFIARTGAPWRDLPDEFGSWAAVDNRFRRWEASGGLTALFRAMTADPRFDGVRRVFADATIARAHRHAAGARRRKKGSGRTRPRDGRAWGGARAG